MAGMEREELKREDLKIGDTVAYPVPIGGYGWHYRYPRWNFDKVKYITPKRTKVYLENGGMRSARHGTHLYAPDDGMHEENMRAKRFVKCVKILTAADSSKSITGQEISRLSEEEIDKVAVITDKIESLMSEIKSLVSDVGDIMKSHSS